MKNYSKKSNAKFNLLISNSKLFDFIHLKQFNENENNRKNRMNKVVYNTNYYMNRIKNIQKCNKLKVFSCLHTSPQSNVLEELQKFTEMNKKAFIDDEINQKYLKLKISKMKTENYLKKIKINDIKNDLKRPNSKSNFVTKIFRRNFSNYLFLDINLQKEENIKEEIEDLKLNLHLKDDDFNKTNNLPKKCRNSDSMTKF